MAHVIDIASDRHLRDVSPRSQPRTGRLGHLHLHCLRTQPGFEGWSHRVAFIDQYPARALMLAERDDVVCVNAPLDSSYLDYLDELQLGFPRDRIVVLNRAVANDENVSQVARLQGDNHAIQRLRDLFSNAERIRLSSFMFTDHEASLCHSLQPVLAKPVEHLGGNAALIRQLCHKHLVRELAITLDVPVAPGEAVAFQQDVTAMRRRRELEQAIHRQLHHTGRAIVRGTLGASGFAVSTTDGSPRSLRECLARIDEVANDAFLVEAMYDVIQSPNVVNWIDPHNGQIHTVSTADQCLTNATEYTGNQFPSKAQLFAEMISDATRLTETFRDQGLTGYIGFDFCEFVSPRTGRRDYVLAEINPRVNGSVYCYRMFERLNMQRVATGRRPLRVFHTTKLPTCGGFDELERRCGDLLYRAEREAGAVPIHFLPEPGSMNSFCFVGETQAEVADLLRLFNQRTNNQIAGLRFAARAA